MWREIEKVSGWISSITDELETQNTYEATVQKKNKRAFHMISEGFLFSSWPAKRI